MEGEGQKFGKFSNFFKDKRIRISCAIIVVLLAAVIALAIYTYKKQDEYQMVSENSYNMSFYELVNCADEIETYLAKAMITSTADHEAKTLSNVWNKANLAVVYLTQIPIKTEGLSNAEKFLNQLGDYSYSLAMKAVEGQDLSDQDLKNIEDLHNYSIDLKNTLNQLETEINDGTLAWKEVVTEGSKAFAQQVSSDASGSFGNIQGTFSEYTGLIYDGAFSEHMVSFDKKGLTGDNISEDQAKEIVRNFANVTDDKIKSNGLSENGNIVSYDFEVTMDDNNSKSIAISQKGGHIVYVNYYREIKENKISPEQAIEIGKNFLNEKGYPSMKETYYMMQDRKYCSKLCIFSR